MFTAIYHLAFVAVDIALAYALFRRWRSHAGAWREATKARHHLGMAIALVLMVIASLAWVLMAWVSIEGWLASTDPGGSRRLFEVFWLVGLFVYGIGMGFAGPLHLLARGRAEEMLRLH